MLLLRKTGIILLVAGIFSTTGIVHFAEDLSGVIAHYEHHNEDHEEVGFFDFLTDHFNHPDRHEKHHPGHNDFPFQHDHSSTCYSPILTFLPVENLTFEIRFVHFDNPESAKINPDQQFNLSEFASAIWQPPRA